MIHPDHSDISLIGAVVNKLRKACVLNYSRNVAKLVQHEPQTKNNKES